MSRSADTSPPQADCNLRLTSADGAVRRRLVPLSSHIHQSLRGGTVGTAGSHRLTAMKDAEGVTCARHLAQSAGCQVSPQDVK